MERGDPFSKFPKERPPLPPEYAAIYLKHYKNSREGNSQILGLAQQAERWMHKKVAEDVKRSPTKSTLEIGAGTLNQLPYEPPSASYDIVEPFSELYQSSTHLYRIRTIYHDVSDVPRDATYDRITSVAVLEHLCNLPELVARSGLLLARDGQFRAGIPSEGTILWRLGWKTTTALDFRLRYKLDYEVLMGYEHVNTAREIEEVLRYFFADIEESVFGLTKSLSFYQFYACSKPRLDRCADHLRSRDVISS
ncbi:MAG: hypothetical protein V7609_920 [Verrucomicrobiota bacterium]